MKNIFGNSSKQQFTIEERRKIIKFQQRSFNRWKTSPCPRCGDTHRAELLNRHNKTYYWICFQCGYDFGPVIDSPYQAYRRQEKKDKRRKKKARPVPECIKAIPEKYVYDPERIKK